MNCAHQESKSNTDKGTLRPLYVIGSFRNRGTEDIFDGTSSVTARKVCPPRLWVAVRRRLDQLKRVRDVQELAVPPGNRLERLRGDCAGQYSIRINDRYRIGFHWEMGNAEEVEITDYH